MNKKKLLAGVIACVTALAGLTMTVCAEDTYMNELTGEPVTTAVMGERPVAIIIDNESIAYPHFGLAEADIVYELINSTLNGHITRLMALYKDYDQIPQVGNIRSVRPTNILLAADYNAILCHDGGPFYVDQYFDAVYAQEHLPGGFTRIKNGKPWEFTEYIVAGEISQRLEAAGIAKTYTGHAQETVSHFRFAPEGADMTPAGNASDCSKAVLPFEHTESTLVYNPETGTYDYYAYGDLHKDAEDGEVLTFKNVFIQECTYNLLDENGYMIYNCIDFDQPGYYLTNGKAVPITWTKDSETGLTRYYNLDGSQVVVNRGKSYVTLVPDDKWDDLVLE